MVTVTVSPGSPVRDSSVLSSVLVVTTCLDSGSSTVGCARPDAVAAAAIATTTAAADHGSGNAQTGHRRRTAAKAQKTRHEGRHACGIVADRTLRQRKIVAIAEAQVVQRGDFFQPSAEP